MDSMIIHKSSIRYVLYFTCIAFLIGSVNSAVAQEVKQIKIGSLHSWFREDGCEPEHGYLKIQQCGMIWPAKYHWSGPTSWETHYQDNVAAKALWIGTTNYTDAEQYGENTYLHKVVHIGPRGWDTEREFMPIEFKLIGRFDHPKVYVDEIEASELKWDDVVDEVHEMLKCDRLIYNVVNTSIGITMTRKIMGWSQQNHDNYFIYEYVFKNTGNVDKDEEIEKPNQTLENVYFFFQYRYAVGREGAELTGLNSPRWGINEMLSTRGEAGSDTNVSGFTYPGDYEEWLNGNPDADSFRCQFAWMGRHSQATVDLIGVPDYKYGTGRFTAPQFIGVVTLHADKSATDKSDDPQQPTTTTFQQSDDPPTRPNDQFDAARMSQEWEWITRGHRLPRHDELVGDGFPDQLEGTPGGFSNMNGYGPYTLGPRDSIRIVLAEGVNGINRQACITLGRDWIEENSPYTLPDGSPTNDRDEFKNAWIMTGQDSLFKTFSRARQNYNLNYEIPQPPPPPSLFEVTSGGDRIQLTWSNNAESWPNFKGYKVYRAIHKPDTTHELIFACGEGTNHPNIVNEYDDTSPQRGFDYYYYITSFDDGSTNDINPGVPLESSIFFTKTMEPAYLRRPAGKSMKDIRIVPNPYNIRARDIQYGASGPDRIMFLDIPAFCTIKIYTERGDLIETIKHTDGTGDEAWNSITSYRTVLFCGLYIAYFEVTEDYHDPVTGELLYKKGEQAIQKFVIIR